MCLSLWVIHLLKNQLFEKLFSDGLIESLGKMFYKILLILGSVICLTNQRYVNEKKDLLNQTILEYKKDVINSSLCDSTLAHLKKCNKTVWILELYWTGPFLKM